MANVTHMMVAAAYILGVLTSTFWYWTSSTAPYSSTTKVDAVSTTSNRSKTLINTQEPHSVVAKVSHERQNNIIMSAATNMDTHDLYRFIRSARSTCNNCSIVLLVNGDVAGNENVQILVETYKVTLIDEGATVGKRKEEPFHKTGIWNKRWVIFYDYLQTLEANGTSFDNVFICDLRDTIFQTNVFAHMDTYGNGVYAFLEDVKWTIGSQEVNAAWIKICYGETMLQAMYNKSISCSGTVLGSRSAMMAYLSSMYSQMMNQSDNCLRSIGSDQGIHNFIVYNVVIPETTVYYVSHETGFVGTTGLPDWLKRNKFGLVLNANKSIYAVVHQLNRSPELLAQYKHEYQMLPDDVLNKKA